MAERTRADKEEITLAVLGNKVDNLTVTVHNFVVEQRKYNDEQRQCNQRQDNDIGALKIEQAKQSERIGIFGIINAGWSALVAAVSGVIAATFKS